MRSSVLEAKSLNIQLFRREWESERVRDVRCEIPQGLSHTKAGVRWEDLWGSVRICEDLWRSVVKYDFLCSKKLKCELFGSKKLKMSAFWLQKAQNVSFLVPKRSKCQFICCFKIQKNSKKLTFRAFWMKKLMFSTFGGKKAHIFIFLKQKPQFSLP